MNNSHSDALVFFGVTGDLAYKKIFPALQAMLKRGHLNVPVIGVAKAGWTLDQLRARVFDSLEKHGGADSAAFEKLSSFISGSGLARMCQLPWAHRLRPGTPGDITGSLTCCSAY
ncbi:hypothetical protein [Edaphobacter aggregans]|uniref:hypothetical protein n=1 Tax=Edaphobacter aggregans TaxID=570835 RepID=UPI0005595EFA